MRSTQLQLDRYRTDKIPNGYMQWYDQIFGADYDTIRTVLELGVYDGGSLELWRDYFPNAHVIGVDADLARCQVTDMDRIRVFEGSQAAPEFLRDVAANAAPEGFDLIIDDASHIAWQTAVAFWTLFDDLRPGGCYVIEDWGTGYLPEWSDGKKGELPSHEGTLLDRIARRFGVNLRRPSHLHGMVGFVKQLIDEQGANDLTRGARQSRFASLMITPGMVVVRKAGGAAG